MKPCYQRKDEFYLLAHVIREGDQFLQPCKALISPGNCPAVTRATGEFWRRCGWPTNEAAPSVEDSETGTADRADSPEGTAQLVCCKLLVGSCQLSTALEVVEDVDLSDRCGLSRWHIHIGREDFEALERDSWDSDICYLSVQVNPAIGVNALQANLKALQIAH
ncbi:hypothetical protein COCOBI_10-0280 [Coccomyxa sp. Obi]|nr:hypothetical protein COCOBI_10-0280 [Coccomyxa sp. Obi]